MKKILIYLFVLNCVMHVFAYDSGTKMWEKATATGRPVSVLLTLTGMATTPLLIPAAIYGLYHREINPFLCPIVGLGFGSLWVVANEFVGVFDVLSFGCASYYPENIKRDDIEIALTMPSYFYYIDEIDNSMEKRKNSIKNRSEDLDEENIE